MAAISSRIGVTAATQHRASKNPKEPSRGVDLDVIAVASVASGPSGLVRKVVANDRRGQGRLSTNLWRSEKSVHHFSTSAAHALRPPRPSWRRDTRERLSTSSDRSGRL